jgi:hypothetical protein
MKLNIKAAGLTGGIFWALSVFVATAWVLVLGDGYNSILDAMGSFYIGYDISWKGSFIGLFYGFFDGAIGCAIFAWLYNFLAQKFK